MEKVNLKIPVCDYKSDVFKRMFNGWNYYDNAPEETKMFFMKIGNKTTYIPGEGRYITEIANYFSETNRRKTVGFVGVLFGEDGNLYICVSSLCKFYGPKGIELLLWLIQYAIDVYSRYLPVLREFGLI